MIDAFSYKHIIYTFFRHVLTASCFSRLITVYHLVVVHNPPIGCFFRSQLVSKDEELLSFLTTGFSVYLAAFKIFIKVTHTLKVQFFFK